MVWGACSGAAVPVPEVCGDHVDNDCNGRTDCADPACQGAVGCVACQPGGMQFNLSVTPADVIFVIDRSGSMGFATADGSSRWDALQAAMGAVLPVLNQTMYMGLLTFPYGSDPNSCLVGPSFDVQVGANTGPLISQALGNTGPNGGTPTLGALFLVERYLRAATSPRPRYIILATDGLPNCTSFDQDAIDLPPVVNEIASIRTNLGVPTFVIGIPGGDPGLVDPLNQMAMAGGRPRSGPELFYDVGSTSDFERAFRAISSVATGCVYGLTSPPPDPSRVVVSFDGVTVAHNASNGWDFTDGTNTAIRFHGASCASLTSGVVHSVAASFGCQ
jgi:hypothetical protein